MAIQDGKDAGQSVFQVHMHLMPTLEKINMTQNQIVEAEERNARTSEVMVEEANIYR